MLAVLALVLVTTLAAAPFAGGNAVVLATGTLPINPSNWVGIALVAVLMVIAVAGFVYVVAGLINSSNARSWARAQIYEAAFSIALLLIFAFFAYLFFLNPQGSFSNAGLVPNGGTPDCSATNTIFTLATCDISYFSNNAFNVAQGLYWIGYLVGLSPGIDIGFNVPFVPALGVSTGIEDFVPIDDEKLIAAGFSAIFFALLINQVQVILLAGSMLFLSVFLTIGLVARAFGVTRTFGGTMISLGIGLGLIYPLLVAITYGFINVQTGTVNILSITNIVEILFTAATAVLTGQLGNATVSIFNSQFVQQLAYAVAGLTFIPFINFVILDAFIRDFSKAIGQQVEFMALLGGLL